MARGMDNYLSKPIRPQELDEILGKYFALQTTSAIAIEAQEFTR
jgi:CheY-like chemotaxis protein